MTGDQAAPGYAVDNARYELDFEDTFDGDLLDERHWLPHHLPQWSSRADSAARYVHGGGVLRLRIAADQAPWCPELDGATRVSSLQTGVFAGPLGSNIGQHRFHPDAVVREAQPSQQLYTPSTACSSCGPRRPTTRAAWSRSG
jgi:hypothetical protein